MNKVICDICGTAYPSSAQKCPICGSAREYALENVDSLSSEADDLLEMEEAFSGFERRNREIFDFDEVNHVKPADRKYDEDDFDDEEYYEEGSRVNIGLVIVLVVLIVLLLLTAGFLFVRYMLPNMTDKSVETEPVVTTELLQTEPVETTDPGVPCTNLSVDGGKMELGKDGKKLLNVRVYPENTTDVLLYTSADESIAAVSEDGTVTAVGEGQTIITVQCGAQQIKCNVTVDYSADEATVPTGEIPAPQVESNEATTDASGESQAAQETEAGNAADSTDAAEETAPAEQKLKLKKEDITISSNYTSVQLELEGDIKPEDLSWFTMDSTIAIVHGGLVTSTGSGLTRIYGEYNGQQVMCIVRCIF